MKQEHKDLLLRYLSMALPYDLQVKTEGDNEPYTLLSVHPNKGIALILTGVNMDGVDITSKVEIDTIKPFLRPMSSMTEAEAKEISILYGIKDILSTKITDEYIEVVVDDNFSSTEKKTIWYNEIVSSIEIFDWLNAHHFDYRNLIEKGLAIEITEK